MIFLVNRQAERLFGYTRAEMVGQPVEMLIPTRLREGHEAHRAAYMPAPRTRPIGAGLKLLAIRKDGTEFPVEVSLSPIRVGRERFVASAIRDLTERERAAEVLRRSEEERFTSMGRMAAYVAHQLNTPLTNVALLTAAIRRQTKDEEVAVTLHKIDEQRRVAAGIIRELMRFGTITDMRRSPMDVRQVVDEAVEQIRAAVHAGVDVKKELPPSAVTVAVDRLQMKEVLVNLLKNALDATHQGQVTIRVENHGPTVRVSVQDTGSGMAPETVAKLFQPFFTTKEKGQGTGLGLAFAKNVVSAHGGTISVESRPGLGSTFTVSLPAQPESLAPPGGPPPGG